MPKGKGRRSKKEELIEVLNENVGVAFYVCDLAVMLETSEATVRRHLEDLRTRYPQAIKSYKHYGRTLYIVQSPIPKEGRDGP
jgi:predicted ArsR family transcriptional regulator